MILWSAFVTYNVVQNLSRVSTYNNRHVDCRLHLGMGHGLWEQRLLFNGAKLTFNFLLAHRTRVSQLEDTKQLIAAPAPEPPPRCWGEPGAGEERRLPRGMPTAHRAPKQGSAGQAMAPAGQGARGRKSARAKSWSGADRHKQVKAGYRTLEGKS